MSKNDFPGMMIQDLRMQLDCQDYGYVPEPVYVALAPCEGCDDELRLLHYVSEVKRINDQLTLVVKGLPQEEPEPEKKIDWSVHLPEKTAHYMVIMEDAQRRGSKMFNVVRLQHSGLSCPRLKAVVHTPVSMHLIPLDEIYYWWPIPVEFPDAPMEQNVEACKGYACCKGGNQ